MIPNPLLGSSELIGDRNKQSAIKNDLREELEQSERRQAGMAEETGESEQITRSKGNGTELWPRCLIFICPDKTEHR